MQVPAPFFNCLVYRCRYVTFFRTSVAAPVKPDAFYCSGYVVRLDGNLSPQLAALLPIGRAHASAVQWEAFVRAIEPRVRQQIADDAAFVDELDR